MLNLGLKNMMLFANQAFEGLVEELSRGANIRILLPSKGVEGWRQIVEERKAAA